MHKKYTGVVIYGKYNTRFLVFKEIILRFNTHTHKKQHKNAYNKTHIYAGFARDYKNKSFSILQLKHFGRIN